MKYLAGLLIVLLCTGIYFCYVIKDQRITEVEDELDQDDATLKAMRTDNVNLLAALGQANTKLKTAGQAVVAIPNPTAPEQAQASADLGNPEAEKALAEAAATAAATAAKNAVPPTNAPAAAAPPANGPTPEQLAQGIVVIKGDNAEGTGFLVKTADGPFIVTNLHVLANNPHIKILTAAGSEIVPTGMKGAIDRDLAMLSMKDGPYAYLPLASDDSKVAHAGDADVTPGNSQGGNVVLSTPGNILALGPDRVEFNNPIYHGNSGGPVFDAVSGVVVGVVTEAMKVDMSNDLDKASFASRSSAITSSMRYFGLRLDTVPKWEPYDMAQYQTETAFLDDFDKQSQALDAYLNTKSGSPEEAQEEHLYLNDRRIMAAADTFQSQLAGTDIAGRIAALRQFGFSLDAVADRNLVAIKNPNSFYTFDRQRAQDEISYRVALKKEIEEFSNDINRIADLPRSNN